MSIFRTLNRL